MGYFKKSKVVPMAQERHRFVGLYLGFSDNLEDPWIVSKDWDISLFLDVRLISTCTA